MFEVRTEVICMLLKLQATHRVIQSSEIRQFKLFTNLMALNDGFL